MDLSVAHHAFVTGGASGIGLGIADALARRGVSVTLADIDPEALDAAVAGRSGQFRVQRLDTRDRDAWVEAKTEAEAAFGPVDILVNNAGIAPDGREFADMDPQSFDRILAINLTGVFNGVTAFAGDLRGRGRGHIVNTASMAGLSLAFPGVGAYAVAKAGVVALSEGLRIELAPHGVGVSVLCPGQVATNLAQSTIKLGGQLRSMQGAMRDSGVSAAKVGEITARAIEANSPYIITHPEQWGAVEKRLNRIRDAFVAPGA
jgi:NAD(P)-dependent dehydrogenase (short-subunit alcohol dehydrogenase family)